MISMMCASLPVLALTCNAFGHRFWFHFRYSFGLILMFFHDRLLMFCEILFLLISMTFGSNYGGSFVSAPPSFHDIFETFSRQRILIVYWSPFASFWYLFECILVPWGPNVNSCCLLFEFFGIRSRKAPAANR